MTTLMNLRIPSQLKDEFSYHCRNRSTYMTTEIIRFIQRFIQEERELLSRPTPKIPTSPRVKPSLKPQDDDGWISPQIDDHRGGWLDRSDYGDW